MLRLGDPVWINTPSIKGCATITALDVPWLFGDQGVEVEGTFGRVLVGYQDVRRA